MQEFIIKAVDLPEDLSYIVTARAKKFDVPPFDEPPFDEIDKFEYNSVSYLTEFERQIDPVIICMFYGLYKSKKLPETQPSQIKFKNIHEFGANITNQVEQFNNLLYALWIKENKIPEKTTDFLKYRKDLYRFLEVIQDYNYFVSSIIPFYLSKANEIAGERSFINRIKHSGYCRYETNDISPEYIALDFMQEQEDFMNYIKIDEIVEKGKVSRINLERDEKGEMVKGEIQNAIETRIDDLEINLRNFLHKNISKQYPNYWDNIEKCIDLKIRAEERISEHLKNNPQERKETINPFEFMSFFDYKKIIVREFWPIFKDTFRSTTDLESNFEYISDVRNVLKHNRNLSDVENKKADYALTWFETILKPDKK
jgi:hypothetical protein